MVLGRPRPPFQLGVLTPLGHTSAQSPLSSSPVVRRSYYIVPFQAPPPPFSFLSGLSPQPPAPDTNPPTSIKYLHEPPLALFRVVCRGTYAKTDCGYVPSYEDLTTLDPPQDPLTGQTIAVDPSTWFQRRVFSGKKSWSPQDDLSIDQSIPLKQTEYSSTTVSGGENITLIPLFLNINDAHSYAVHRWNQLRRENDLVDPAVKIFRIDSRDIKWRITNPAEAVWPVPKTGSSTDTPRVQLLRHPVPKVQVQLWNEAGRATMPIPTGPRYPTPSRRHTNNNFQRHARRKDSGIAFSGNHVAQAKPAPRPILQAEPEKEAEWVAAGSMPEDLVTREIVALTTLWEEVVVPYAWGGAGLKRCATNFRCEWQKDKVEIPW